MSLTSNHRTAHWPVRRAHAAVAAGGILSFLLISAAPAIAADAVANSSLDAAGLAKWRADREARLRADGGWLTVEGLFWLKEGANRLGSAPGSGVRLPSSAPANAGVVEFSGKHAVVKLEPDVKANLDGQAVTSVELRPDTSGKPNTLALGPLTLHLIERGGRYGIRLKDNASPRRKEFKGLVWFPPSDAWRLTARFVAYEKPKPIPIANVLGQVSDLMSPGYVTFTVGGREQRLYPVLEDPGDKELFFIFHDETSGKSTYGAGRFLYTDLPKDGKVVLDFNKAVTPPCGFTPYATCPLPPRENWLNVAVEAGEKDPHVLH